MIDFSSDKHTKEYSRNLADIREENFLTETIKLEEYGALAEQLDEERLDIENSYFGRIMTRSTLRIPKYQRNYSWTEDNHEQLWYDLRDTLLLLNEEGEEEPDLKESFFGALYLSTEDVEENLLQIIDGQQRLATTAIILNILRRRVEARLENLQEAEKAFCKYLMNHFIVKPLYGDSADAGISSSLSVELRGFDNKYFRILFEDSDRRLLGIISEMEEGTPGELIKISTLLGRIGRSPTQISDRALEEFDDDFLEQKVYFASQGSHAKLLNAHTFYEGVIDEFLSADLDLSEEADMNRIFAMMNIALVIMRSFRVIRSRLSTRVSPETKVQFFQSLNETGESLTTSDKIRARIVAEFGFDEAEIGSWEEVTTEFGDNSENIENYLVDYLISDLTRNDIPSLSDDEMSENEAGESGESETDDESEDTEAEEEDEEAATEDGLDYIKKSDISDHLLDAFAISKRPRPHLESKLIGEEVDAASFLSSLETSAPRYNEIKRRRFAKDYFDQETAWDRSMEYLARLKGSQWRPLVLLLYNELTNPDSSLNDQVLVKMLDVVENILLRFALTGERAATIEPTFATPCLYFNEREVPNKIQNRFGIDRTEFSTLNTNLLTELILESTDMEKLSQNSLTNALMYNNTWSRLGDILVRIAQENMRSIGGEEARRATGHSEWLKGEELEMEHILPSTPKLNGENISEPYTWIDNFVQYSSSAEDQANRNDEENESSRMPNWLTEDDIDEIKNGGAEAERVLNRIQNIFIDDPGNRMLIHKTVNNRVKNKPFSIKIVFYYLTSYTDMKSMGEYLANLDNIDSSEEEIVELVDSLSHTAELTEEEANILFYRLSNAFSIDRERIESSATHYDNLEDWDRISKDKITEYDSVAPLLTDHNINESEYNRIYKDDWADFDIKSDEGITFVHSEDDPEDRSYDDFLNEITEAILLKIARVDVTCEEVDDIITEYNAKWNWERMVDRKAHLVEQALSTLSFDTREFDRENISKEDAYEQIFSQTDRAY